MQNLIAEKKLSPGIFNQREADAPSFFCPVNMVTKSKITIIPEKDLLSFPMCSYFTVPTALIMAKP